MGDRWRILVDNEATRLESPTEIAEKQESITCSGELT
jgi:hypothetical protein